MGKKPYVLSLTKIDYLLASFYRLMYVPLKLPRTCQGLFRLARAVKERKKVRESSTGAGDVEEKG